MSSDLARQNAVRRVRDLILSAEAPQSQKATKLGTNVVASRDKMSTARMETASAIHSVREANNNVSEIVTSALAGEPQIIKKRGGRAVIVISIETAKDLLALAERPRSLADMFPVDENNPPVSPLVITHRPGRTRVKF